MTTLFEEERKPPPRVGEGPVSENVRRRLADWDEYMADLRARVQATLAPEPQPERRAPRTGMLSD
ncbi:MAG: hypothetical protein HYW81_02270 [Parcubacteria group bacterium]|nr:hypothetical protein [Parcubacteria group bacterium]